MSIRPLSVRQAADVLKGTPYFGYGQAPGYRGNTPEGAARFLIKSAHEEYYLQGEITRQRTLNSYFPNMYGGLVPLQTSYERINDVFLQLDKFVEGETYQLGNHPYISVIERPAIPGGLSAAILKVPDTHDNYLKDIGDKSRNMVRKPEKNGFRIELFDKNCYLNDIYAIHTSLDVRQGQPLADHYRTRMHANYRPRASWELISEEWWGAFASDGKLAGYIYLPGTNGEYLTSRIMGHGEFLRFGIMNALLSEVIRKHAGENAHIMYGMYEHGTDGLRQFKTSMGFRPVPCLRYAFGPGHLKGRVFLGGVATLNASNPVAKLKEWAKKNPRVRAWLLNGRAQLQRMKKRRVK